MSTSPSPPLRRIAVVGGGISGLAAAHRLHEIDPGVDLVLFEASDRLGGVLQTSRLDGYLVEHSADNFITNVPWGVDLCRAVGLEDQLCATDDRFRKAYVAHQGRLVEVPEGFSLMAPARV